MSSACARLNWSARRPISILLVGAAVIREREHGTIEHLLAMPVTPTDIMLAKIWANGLVILEHYGNSPFADAGLPGRTGISIGCCRVPAAGSTGSAGESRERNTVPGASGTNCTRCFSTSRW